MRAAASLDVIAEEGREAWELLWSELDEETLDEMYEFLVEYMCVMTIEPPQKNNDPTS